MASDSRRTGRRLFAFVAALAVGTAGGLVAVRLGDRDDTPIEATSDARVVGDDVGHVHGVGYNPADGRWYLGTHSGLLRADPDGIVRVADRYQDTMGLTVVKGDEFLASGHPDLREDLPSSLGLIRSNDRGRTWAPVSLSGEADLHAIAVAPDHLYAADATTGTLLFSGNGGESWERRAKIDLVALAVDPNEPLHLIGIGPDGTAVRSTDGGANFGPVPGPLLSGVVFADTPVAVDPTGAVYALEGDTWIKRGNVGTPNPVLGASGPQLAAAAEDGTMRYSGDGGRTWNAADVASVHVPACKPQRPSCRNVRR